MKIHYFLNHAVVIMFLTILLSGCNSEKKDWQKAQSINSLEGFQEFLKLHPKSEFAIYAADSIDWIMTQKSDSLEKYKAFLIKYPKSNHSKIANQYINLNLNSNCKDAIELMFVFWSNTINPAKREGMVFFGGESLTISTTGKASGIIKLDSSLYSQTLIKKLDKYKNIKCSIELKAVVHNYFGTQTIIQEDSKFVCSIYVEENLQISLNKGEIGLLKNKEFYVKDNTSLTINNKKYSFLNNRWIKTDN